MKNGDTILEDYIKIGIEPNKGKYEHIPRFIKNKLLYSPERIKADILCTGGLKGLILTLPFDKEELSHISKEQLRRYFNRIENAYITQKTAIILEDELKEKYELQVGEEKMLEQLFLFYCKAIYQKIIKKHQMEKNRLKLFIIDNMEDETKIVIKECIRQLTCEAQSIAVMTDEKGKEIMGDFYNEIYHETGLLIEEVTYPPKNKQTANIVFNFSYAPHKAYHFFSEETIIFDFAYNQERARRACNLNSNLTIYKDIICYSLHERVDSFLLAKILIEGSQDFGQYSIAMRGIE